MSRSTCSLTEHVRHPLGSRCPLLWEHELPPCAAERVACAAERVTWYVRYFMRLQGSLKLP